MSLYIRYAPSAISSGGTGTGGGTGTVTSVGLSAPAFLTVSGSPVTTSGTLTLSYSGLALPVVNGGTGTTTSTGTTNLVLSNGPTLLNANMTGATSFPGSSAIDTFGNLTLGGTATATRFISTIATGTAPFTVTSTTQVANLNAATAGNASTVTTNANLTGPITSVGNATAIASQTGTGSTFVMNTAPTIATLTLTGVTSFPGSSSIDGSGNALFGGTLGVTGTSTLTGNVGIGMTAVRKLDITGTFGATGAAVFGSTLNVAGLTSLAATNFPNSSSIDGSGNAAFGGALATGSSSVPSNWGIQNNVATSGSSTQIGIGNAGTAASSATDYESFRSSPSTVAALALSTLEHFQINDAFKNTGSSIGSQYGVYVSQLTAATTNYAIYTSGSTQSYFGGSVGIGGTLAVTGVATLGSTSGVTGSSAGGYVEYHVNNTSATGFADIQLNVGPAAANGTAGIYYRPGTAFSFGVAANDTTTPLTFSNNNGQTRMTIDTSGNITANTGSIKATSTTAGLSLISGTYANTTTIPNATGSKAFTWGGVNGFGVVMIGDNSSGASATVYYGATTTPTIVNNVGTEFVTGAAPAAGKTGIVGVPGSGGITVYNNTATNNAQYQLVVIGI